MNPKDKEMNKKIFEFALLWAVLFVIGFVIGAFYAANIDIRQWTIEVRKAVAFVPALISVFLTFLRLVLA